MKFLERLSRGPVFFDGAMGTQLIARGLVPGESSESWNISHPEAVQKVHEAYLQVGCQVLTTNTFGAHPLKWGGEKATELIRAALAIARKAAGNAYVALDMGPTGRLLKPFGDLSFPEAYASYAGMVQAGKDEADLILIETLTDLFEARAAVLAAKEHSALPVVVTMSLDEKGMLLTGSDVKAMIAALEGLGVDALGFNCGLGPVELAPFVKEAYSFATVPLLVSPNAGLPVSVNGRAVYQLPPEEFAGAMDVLLGLGARGLGGCCGTTPEHLHCMTRALAGKQPLLLPEKSRGRISSYARVLCPENGPFLVGERLNPTGKPRMKEALRRGDADFMLLEALRQEEHGADILDLNVGLPGIDEAGAMEELVDALQGVTRLPLQLDSSDPKALEAGLRRYCGCALINSVNGTRESMDLILPLARKYGASLVALTLDETGIPESAEDRVAIALKIIREAETYGIHRDRIIVDPLCMAISAGPGGAQATLKALDLLARQQIRTALGVSNVSFGLPDRPGLNAAMLTLALGNGLSFAIANPMDPVLLDAWQRFLALSGRDPGCAAYIARFAAQEQSEKAAVPDMTLQEAVIRGLKGQAAALTQELLKSLPPLRIIDEALIPALNQVGSAFETGKMFLPQLLMSADAASAGFQRIRLALATSGEARDKGTIVLATVQGDIHDIGKNIVRALLENYGYRVVDLGRDVAPERVMRAVEEEDAGLVGLSALMTTTVEAMERTIRLLKEKSACPVMVGGAVLTPDYAAAIGADYYCRDAMQSVRCAQTIFEPGP